VAINKANENPKAEEGSRQGDDIRSYGNTEKSARDRCLRKGKKEEQIEHEKKGGADDNLEKRGKGKTPSA